MPIPAEVVGSDPATGAEKAHELILAILFAEIAKVASLPLQEAARFFEEVAEETADGAESRVYQKFALVLKKHDEARSSSLLQPHAWPKLRIVRGGKGHPS